MSFLSRDKKKSKAKVGLWIGIAFFLLFLHSGCERFRIGEKEDGGSESVRQKPGATEQVVEEGGGQVGEEGAAREEGERQSFFRIVENDGVWAFERDGEFFVSLGINVIRPKEEAPRDPAKAYDGLARWGGDFGRWVEETRKRLETWGFNTVGAWSHDVMNASGLAWVKVVWLGGQSGHGVRADMRLIDVFDPSYAEEIQEQARREVAPHAGDEHLLGFFINNELPFYGDFGWPTDPERSLWDRYLELPVDAPGRIRAVEFFVSHYGSEERARASWDFESFEALHRGGRPVARGIDAQRFKHLWAGVVADRYYELASGAIRKHAPKHLILGSRHAGRPMADVVCAESKYVDVISLNHYRPLGDPDVEMLRNLHALTRRPIMITEFSWRAVENRSGNLNNKGAEVTVASQADRAAAYGKYISRWMAEPYAVGAHWFQYHDQPADGRAFDGENSNYGLVDVKDEPYEELVEVMAQTNREVLSNFVQRKGLGDLVFNPESWGELLPVRLDGGRLEQPVRLDLGSVGGTSVKADKGASGRVFRTEEGAVLEFESGNGWGLHADFGIEPRRVAGAGAMRIRLKGDSGMRFRIFLTETGDGPPGQQTYQGVEGADGESFEFAPFTATGEWQEVEIPLQEASVRQYWGNQRGDRMLSTAGLGTLSLFVFPNQGAGRCFLEWIDFQPNTENKEDEKPEISQQGYNE